MPKRIPGVNPEEKHRGLVTSIRACYLDLLKQRRKMPLFMRLPPYGRLDDVPRSAISRKRDYLGGDFMETTAAQTLPTESKGRTVNESEVTLSQVILPMHTGPGGVFAHGGEIIKLMDTAAGLAALRHARSQVVTLRVEGINFLHPIRVGNFVTVHAKPTYASQSSMEIQVIVTAEHVLKERRWEALRAYFIFVALDDEGNPKKVPALIVQTEEERKLFESGEERYSTCRIDDHYRTLCAID
jgi:acyl-CoA hydrolase